MDSFIEKLKSRKLWALIAWVGLALYDKDLGAQLAPMFMGYILGQSFADGVGTMTVTK